jgi:diacylglycerol kinase (ATP)
VSAPGAVVVFNRQAGTAARRRAVRAALASAASAVPAGTGEVVVRETASPQDGLAAARQAARDGVPRVVAAGGDGTLQAVVAGLVAGQPDAAARPWLGIVPAGRGNDLARALGLPAEPRAALGLALAGERARPLDLGRLVADGRELLFVNAAGLGFDGDVAVRARRLPLRGFPAYALAALGSLAALPGPWEMAGTIDGRPVRGAVTIFTVANGHTTGGGFVIAAAARPDDGLLDFGRLGPSRRAEVLRLLWRALRADLGREPRFELGRFVELTASFSPGIPVHADGEIVSAGAREVTIAVLPSALRAVVPGQG